MTWNPRKKYFMQKPTPAQPCLTEEEDRELLIAVQRIIHTESTVRNMIKEMKRYLEAIEQLDKSDQRLTTNLSSCGLVHIHDDFRHIIEDYHSVTTQVGRTVADRISHCNKTFIEPLKKLRDEFIYIKEALTKREELVINWRVAYTNLKKYQEKREKTATHIVKLERERKSEEQASKELKIYHSRLLTELPMFLEKRLEYLKPTVHALIAIQLEYYGNSTKMFTQLMPVPNASESPTSAMVSDEEYNHTINSYFNKIRNLTIIKK
ncbi:bridging integrator 3 homolog [Phymastichus coffea]|uniref:bridging integrator 3 homolog n=1 Tax=Phymastichus coffea TaxID=108790 RepID=UPI00273C7FC6|nr:bridging integrator 3 homolog [Phymastichus coffea]XP_058794065.1 bridging integrator 3 homolog [Phymastichus coffea]XP_058794066.1 bridging integrator 3 homolog [Phymastichus coffea]